MIASEGPAVDSEVAQSAPIIDYHAPEPVPAFTPQSIPGLPPEAQPAPGDVLLSRAFWPWTDLGAEGIPEHWLYMTRRVQGVIAQLAVQTPSGPRLVQADKLGRIISGAYYDRNAAALRFITNAIRAPHGTEIHQTYNVPANRQAIVESMSVGATRTQADTAAGEVHCEIQIGTGVDQGHWGLDFIDNTVGADRYRDVGQAGFLTAGTQVLLVTSDGGAGPAGLVKYEMQLMITEFDA